ncbi:MAG: DEAD/DEAH box helicase family protein [Desulfobacterales bacterium]|nr:DEAD/DEAH box helicase family protein [Desulfobacterales bacterium]
MASRKSKGPRPHKFRNKLLLNQWLVSLFGIDPFQEHKLNGKIARPFHVLSDPIKDPRMEGLDHDNLHKFYFNLINSDLFWNFSGRISKEQLLVYEENIVRHTQAINARRYRPVVWKYFQWLTLLFAEIYLDRYFNGFEALLNDLNQFAADFNRHWHDYSDVPLYTEDDLNKLCLQNATGSGKTLLMHVNLLQYRHYAKQSGRDKELSRVILLTPNERLSEQHINEFMESGLQAKAYRKDQDPLFSMAMGLGRVDVLEVTKLADQEGPNTIATRSLGDQNLLLVDEGHRGMSGKEQGAWLTRRAALCAKGFTFEYSATFEQAVLAAKNDTFENSYARSIIFDYSYRWFYEDGFGKDYQILNLPQSFDEIRAVYLTACVLKFYQQLCIYQKKAMEFEPFNLEKPLWIFVGSTVSKAKGSQDEIAVAADVAQIIQFLAAFLSEPDEFQRRINEIITGNGSTTGLLDKDGNDIFDGSFTYLAKVMNAGESIQDIYKGILSRLFNNPAGGQLEMARLKGDSGEIALKAGSAEEPFGLINVGDAKGLCDHVEEVAKHHGTKVTVAESDFTEAMFASVKDSASPVNLLIGSKKFVEGWDCWRVSTMGLMHVGKSEGSQIIQLFGRGVRLKGYAWSLKRSGHVAAPQRPLFIEELETLNVFGIEADFMEKFREFLKEEGLPGNERRKIITMPLNVTYDFGKKLKILRPKRKASDGKEYDFKKDAPVPTIGELPDYLTHNTIVSDWYPRIQSVQSLKTGSISQKDRVQLRDEHLAFLDYDALFFEIERFKRERSWYNLNISKEGIRRLLANSTWYTLYMPQTRLNLSGFDDVLLLQQVATELLKRYCDHYYNYCKREYIEPRLELRELSSDDDNFPSDDQYQLIVDGDEAQLILAIERVKAELEKHKDKLLREGDLRACNFGKHLYQPLFHVRRGSKISILPVALNESEYQFVKDLKDWCDVNKDKLSQDKSELFLLRNMSRGKGVGFFEAGNFHPDFILWLLNGKKQHVSFIEPHGLLHEGPGSEKVLLHKRIKDVQKRLGDPDVILNSFILSWSKFPQLKWDRSQAELEKMNVFFMTDDRDHYIDKLFTRLRDQA